MSTKRRWYIALSVALPSLFVFFVRLYYLQVNSKPGAVSLSPAPTTTYEQRAQAVTTTDLTKVYHDEQYHYTVRYNANWTISGDSEGTVFFASGAGGKPFFSVGINTSDEGVPASEGGVPSIAYYALLQGKVMRPLVSDKIRDLSDVCAIRDDTHVYIQRDNVLYGLFANSGSSADFPEPFPVALRPEFEAFVSSFKFDEPWAPPVKTDIPTPCWR